MSGGYQDTDFGNFPEDWDIVPVGDLFTFKNGLNKAKEFFGHGTSIVNYMDVYNHPALRVRMVEGKVDVTSKEQQSYEVLKGDVFFTRTSETVEEIGTAAVMLDDTQSTVFSGFVLRARPSDDALVDEFKAYCFRPRYFRDQVTSRASYTTRALTNGKSLSATMLAKPSRSEQHAIAEALGDVYALLDGLDRLIAKKRDLKTGTMQQLLTGKKRLVGFNGEWEECELGELLDYEQPTKYLVSSTEYSEQYNIPVLTAGKSFLLGMTNETHGIYANVPVIIFDDFTTASKYVDFPFKAKSSAMKMLAKKRKIDNLRILYEIMRTAEFIKSGHKRYWIAEYQRVKVGVPSPSEQAALAQVLSDMESEINFLEAKRKKSYRLKQAMMQELLTGKTRLPFKEAAND
ncbi:restriction endonuclease subunit S [Pseudohalocynthiibacter sp. F2068]|nr:restriction endonuclease subunit S [Pseudohalocynthiibacter sp. F2068]